MTELSREQIETVRVLAQHYDGTAVELFGVSVRALCDLALRTLDAEADRDRYRALLTVTASVLSEDGDTTEDDARVLYQRITFALEGKK